MSAPGSPPAAGRTHFLDRLKVVLTVWVILHHTAITYGGNGGWFYRELPTSGSASSLVLTLFCAVNQAFFMGAFFLLAGYFTPPALAHKGAWHFVQDRLRRLGLPVLVFGLLLGPLTVALAGWRTGRPPSLGQFVLGPLWFAWALVCFSLAYVAWRRLRPAPPDIPDRPLPGSAAWAVAAIGVGASALALRQVVPVGDSVWGLQLGYFASYIFLFALGCVAQRHRWLERVDRQQALRWRRISLLAVPVFAAGGGFVWWLARQGCEFQRRHGLARRGVRPVGALGCLVVGAVSRAIQHRQRTLAAFGGPSLCGVHTALPGVGGGVGGTVRTCASGAAEICAGGRLRQRVVFCHRWRPVACAGGAAPAGGLDKLASATQTA